MPTAVCVAADCLRYTNRRHKKDPHGFPKMEGKWQLRMLEAWPWWEWDYCSSNWAKTGDSGGIKLLLNQRGMTLGNRGQKDPFFPSFSTVFDCEDSNLCAHQLYLHCSRLLGILFIDPQLLHTKKKEKNSTDE